MNSHNPYARVLSAALIGLAFAGAAKAATYKLSGQFGTTVYSGPLNGGSFIGTFDFTRPAMGSFDILMRDASNTLRFELTNANATANFLPNWGGSGYDAIQIITLGSQTTATILTLDFALGFSGAGTVVPYGPAFPFTSFATLGGQTTNTTSTVISGISVPVPEPAAWALYGLGLAALAVRRLRPLAPTA